MKTNTNKDCAMSFGKIGKYYIEGRIDFDSPLIKIQLMKYIYPTSRVFEFGAGSGALTGVLSDISNIVVASEPDPILYDALENMAKSHNNVKTEMMTLKEFSETKNGKYNIVCSANTLHWIDNNEAFDSIFKILEREGKVISLWNYPFIDGLEDIFSDIEKHGFSTHMMRDTEKPTESIIEDGLVDFLNKSKEKLEYIFIDINDRINMTYKSLSNLIASYNLNGFTDDSYSHLEEIIKSKGDSFVIDNRIMGWVVKNKQDLYEN